MHRLTRCKRVHGEIALKTGATDAGERVGQAIINLRRNPYNRAIQRHIYLVGDHELTPVQVDILETIVANPGQRMNELAQALGVDASTVSRTTMPLVELGLIERRQDTSDRRLAMLHPSPAGLKQASTIAASRREMMHALHRHFTPERLAMFADLLEQYIDVLTIEGMALLGQTREST